MTGQYPHKHGITANIEDLGCTVKELHNHERLLSRRLEHVGYQLGYTGKWHLGSNLKEIHGYPNTGSLPKDVGFEGQNFPGHGSGGFGYEEYKNYLHENGFTHELLPWHGKTKPCMKMGLLKGGTESTVDHFLANNTISLIDKFTKTDKPFLIWHNFWGPHSPYYVPQQWYELYKHIEIPIWKNFNWPACDMDGPHRITTHPDCKNLTWEDWAETIRHYYAFTSLIDFQIGRLLNHLEETGIADNTHVIFCADHGESIGSHGGLVNKGFHHFEETHRIPFMIKFANRAHCGKRVSDLVSLADFYPTVMQMAQADMLPDNPIHGRSLLELLNGCSGWRDYVVTEFNGLASHLLTQRTIRYGNLKYGYNCGFSEELYDLSIDPYETRNRVKEKQYAQKLILCRNTLYEWMKQTEDRAQYLIRDMVLPRTF
jgi:arylsulfatase A-like enzyme